MPSPKNIEETAIYNDVYELCIEFGTDFVEIKNNSSIKIGEYAFELVYTSILGKEDKIMLTILAGGKRHTYLSPKMLDDDTKGVAAKIIDESHTVIFGNHACDEEYKFTYKLRNCERLIFANQNVLIHTDTANYYYDKSSQIIYADDTVDIIR